MRVCYFIPMVDYATGWGRWAVDLLNEVCRHGVEPVLVLPSSQKEQHNLLRLDKFESRFFGPEPYLSFHTHRSVNLRGLRDLVTLKRKFSALRDISLIHAADLYPWGYFGLQLKRMICAPLILTNHSKLLFNPRKSLLDYRLCGKALEGCDRVCSVSRWGSDQIRISYPSLPQSRFAVIHNGVDLKRMAGAAEKLGSSPRQIGKAPIILSVTRFIHLKSIETSVLAFSELKKQFPEAVYYIVGPRTVRSYVEEIKALISRKNLQGVQIVGKTASLEELCGYYSIADVLIHTSSSESFPLIFLEAGFFGLPVVATRVGGVPEVVVDGVNGLLVESGDHMGLAKAVKHILNDPDFAEKLSVGGRRRSSEHSTERVAAEYLALYRDVMKSKK